MGDEPHHECGFALLRLLKPAEYYEEKYGTRFFGLNRMYLMMEKQRSRGQDGCGIASVKLDVPPGTRYINCEKSIDKDPIKDVFERVQKMANDKFQRAPPEARMEAASDRADGQPKAAGKTHIDPGWVKENVPFAGELFLGHVRYGTDSDNSIDRCHPVLRESNWMTRSLLLAGNFNITNNEDLFSSLVQIGQHPRELSDTVTLLEKIGHFVDKENNDLYVKYSATGQAPRTCFSLIAESINVARILRRASVDWDGGYCIAGLFGHGDAFVLRDPSGIRPAFYLANDEVICVASEAPLIQTVFQCNGDQVHPLSPGQALCIKRSGRWALERVLPALALKQCSFERIYFSRGNDAAVYRERERLGRFLCQPLVKILEAKGDTLANAVLSFIPNTAELAYNGLVKEAQDEMSRKRAEVITQLTQKGMSLEEALQKVESLKARSEKVVHKEAKIRTFIQEDSSREHLTLHAYDVHYGTVRPHEDVLVAIDDSIVRGNTLKNAILRTLDRLGPKRIVVLSSCPQIRFPDVYGIDMAKLGDLAAFKAAVTMLQDSGRSQILDEVYKACRAQLAQPLSSGEFVNHVKRVYDAFTPEEISSQIAKQVTPSDCNAEVEILYNTVEALHQAMPEHAGDWYFTGDYPTPGGVKACCRAFVLWMEGSSARCYGVSSASSCAKTPVLVIGHGGAEHALAWKISLSNEVGCVYVAPGNGGTIGQQAFNSGHPDKAHGVKPDTAPLIPVDVPLAPPLFKEVRDFCKERSITLAVVGSEELLSQGLADVLRGAGVPVFGPSQAAAEIDSSRAFSKPFAQKHGVQMAEAPHDEAGLEDWPRGAEVSVLTFTDGIHHEILPVAVQDHKRTQHQDRGSITDGMGAFAPSLLVDAEMLARIEREIIRPVLDGLREDDRAFSGCLHTEIVIMPSGPKVIGFRCCLGDPVAQAALPLLELELFKVLSACACRRLAGNPLRVLPETSVVAVVMASGGYPGSFKRGFAVTGLERALCVPGAHIFHCGTALEDECTATNGTPPKAASPVRRMSSLSTIAPPPISHHLQTCGGRVLTVAAVGRGLNEARERAYVGVRAINFTDAWYRHDIAAFATLRSEACAQPTAEAFHPPPRPEEFTYRAAGVDNEALDVAMASFKPLARKTQAGSSCVTTDEKTCDIGSVMQGGRHSLLSTTANVGTKMVVAKKCNRFDTVGIDLVALCANHLAARGAEPLFFHEHLSTEKLDAHQAMELVKGVADGCVEAGCALIDTGVSELPGILAPGGSDFVGFAVGAIKPEAVLPNISAMKGGDVLIALPASGMHSNGFALIRCIIRAAGLEYSQAAPFDPTRSLGDALLPASRIYVKPVLSVAREGLLLGAAQVASGGLARCFDEVLPSHLAAHLRADAWELPVAFRWLAAVGKIRSRELSSTFNCGLGMVLVVAQESVDRVMHLLRDQREEPVVAGELVTRAQGAQPVEIEGADGAWLMLPELGVSLPFPEVLSSLQDPWTVSRMRVVVLAGSEDVTSVQALVQATSLPASAAVLVAVISADPNSHALRVARSAGVMSHVLGDGRFTEAGFFCDGLDDLDVGSSPDSAAGADSGGGPGINASADFSAQLDHSMVSLQAELLVVLDDVDPSLLTRSFLTTHEGRVAVLHASLLPSFPGAQPVEAALRSGVCITGCTMCFAVPPVSLGPGRFCYGPQILQETCRITATDTSATLRARLVSQCESYVLPRAVQLIASGSVALQRDEGGYGLGRSASFTEAASQGLLGRSHKTV